MKRFSFSDADEMHVEETLPDNPDGSPARTAWSMSADQVAKHRPMFDATMSDEEKARAQAIADKHDPGRARGR